MESKKLIIIPEDRPLYAMRRTLGPERGPILKPIPVTISVIGELLMQTGSEKLTVYEVMKHGNRYTREVQLTLDNYTLPYDEILNGKTGPAPNNTVPVKDPVVEVAPEVIENAENAEEERISEKAEHIDSALETDNFGDADVVGVAEASDSGTLPEDISVTQGNPYSGLSKKARKKAERRDRMAAKLSEES